ncbi:MAG: hypothetical protein K1X72_23690 [Pyrinomonadaceae bacterium]|nr:hypothetical protein [Pyrinomonadaceae bacterium]
MTFASNIFLIFFAVFGGLFAVTTIILVWRVVWAMRNPKKFEEFQLRQAAYRQLRINKYHQTEFARIAAGKPSWTGRFFGAVFTLTGVAISVLSIWQIYNKGLSFSLSQNFSGTLICFSLGGYFFYVSRRRKPQK